MSKNGSQSKPRDKLLNKQALRVLIIPLSWCILSLYAGFFQVARASDWDDEMPTPEEFKADLLQTYSPIAEQYVPYGLGLMALGLLFRKL